MPTTFSHIPPTGTILPRSQFPFESVSGKIRDCDWMANVNYCCHDPYGPNQRVEVRGISVTVWADPMRSSNRIIEPGEDVEQVVECILMEALDQCDHEGAVEISGDEAAKHGVKHFGNCYHTYRCPKCKAVYGIDTSG